MVRGTRHSRHRTDKDKHRIFFVLSFFRKLSDFAKKPRRIHDDDETRRIISRDVKVEVVLGILQIGVADEERIRRLLLDGGGIGRGPETSLRRVLKRGSGVGASQGPPRVTQSVVQTQEERFDCGVSIATACVLHTRVI